MAALNREVAYTHTLSQLLLEYLSQEHQDKKGSPFDNSGWTMHTPKVSLQYGRSGSDDIDRIV